MIQPGGGSRLAVEAAQGAGAKVEMGDRARQLYEAFSAEGGNGGLDFSAIINSL